MKTKAVPQIDKDTLITSNLKLVWEVITKDFPASAGDEDLYQEGCIGLMQAADTWDETKGVPFHNYACLCIRTEILNVLKCRRSKQRSLFETCSISSVSKELDDGAIEDIIPGAKDIDYLDCEEFLSRLTEREKKALWLSYIGYSQSEIAKIIGESRQVVYLIFKKIRCKWNKPCGGYKKYVKEIKTDLYAR